MSQYLDAFIQFVSSHQNYAYLILFIGAIFDTLFPISFFVYGEIFFLAGSILAGTGVLDIYYVAPLLYAGALIGDSSSYFLGYRYGDACIKWILSKKWIGKSFQENGKQKLIQMLESKGPITIFLSRVGGPMARITPFIIGSLHYNYIKFLKYNVLGVAFGVSLFIFAGYFFGTNYASILHYIYNYIFLILLIAIIGFVSYIYLFRYLKAHKYSNLKSIQALRYKKKIVRICLKHSLLFLSLLLVIYGVFLYMVFFTGKTPTNNYFNFENQISDIQTLKTTDINTYFYGQNSKSVQPINCVIITKKDIESIMSDLDWEENQIILKDTISLRQYIRSFRQKMLPMTNLTLMGKNQDFAYQMKSKSNKKRTHLRGWQYGMYGDKFVYLITISNDDEYEIDLYNKFLTPMHEIDRYIDTPRDALLKQISQTYPGSSLEKLELSPKTTKSYETDGIIYIITL